MPVVATSLVSLLEKLKVEEPYFPPRNWESLPSQSGRFLPPTRASASPSPSPSSSVSVSLARCNLVKSNLRESICFFLLSMWLRSDTLIRDLGKYQF